MAWNMDGTEYADETQMVERAVREGLLEAEQKDWVDETYTASDLFQLALDYENAKRIIEEMDETYIDHLLVENQPVEGEDWAVGKRILAVWEE